MRHISNIFELDLFSKSIQVVLKLANQEEEENVSNK